MITVLMAAKTSTEFMPNAVGSLLGQSYTDWQLIIGVNGLPDDHPAHKMAEQLTDAFPSEGNDTAVIHMGDCHGKGEALNHMMAYARGDYVAILDVDDLWHPLKLERQLPYLKGGFDVVGTQAEYFGDLHSDIGVLRGRIGLNELRYGNCIINSSAVMRREHARWKPMNEPIEDYELWLRLASEKREMFNLDQYLTFIRQHANNWSKQSNHEAAVAALRSRYA